ncbi:MAG: glycosyltransferase family protein [bacterium]
MKVLFGVCSWGLGHATRDLPILRRIIEAGHSLTLVGMGRSLDLLKDELQDACGYVSVPDYSSAYSERDFSVAKFLSYFPIYMSEVVKEHRQIKKLIMREKYERIISDNRYGVYDKEIPSYLISHQLRFIAPGRIKLFEMATEGFNYSFFKNNFSKFLVPDHKVDNLSGDLSHNLKYFKPERIEYLGLLSDLKKRETAQDIDYFISLSGPEPQRTILEKKIFEQAPVLKGKVVIALGKPEDPRNEWVNHLRVFGYLGRKSQEEIMNRSKLVVTRPGYTTLMELSLLGKKALFIPTPGQTEQVYLADYHKKRKNFYCVDQQRLNLTRDVEEAKKYPGLVHKTTTHEAVDRFMKIVFGG